MKESLLNLTWNNLFKDYDILSKIKNNGQFEIKAKFIKKYREPRLVTKFDNFEQLPEIFKQNNLGIFPISREAYLIGKYNLFFPLEDNENEIKNVNSQLNFESLDPEKIDSESEAIQIAYLNKILADFIEDDYLNSTFFGKKGVGSFEFKVQDNNGNIYPVKVDGGIMEVDSTYESDKNFVIIEAKKNYSKNFLIRQLYFPYRYFYKKITKNIRLVFLTHFDDKFRLNEYKFINPELYNSIKLVKSKTYTITKIDIDKNNIVESLINSSVSEEPAVPFPQANDLKRVFEICDYLSNHEFNKEIIKKNQNFHLRQVDYYLNAGRYLGFIEKYKSIYKLSIYGHKLVEESLKNKFYLVFKSLIKHKLFNKIFKMYFIDKKPIDKNIIIEEMNKSFLYKINKKSTIIRRSSTVKNWLKLIVKFFSDYQNKVK